MQSGSSSSNSLDRPRSHFGNFFGTVIALLTLVLPLVIINHYSGIRDSSPSTYPTPRLRK
uniref:Uncharacterized protein n=1 Tax=Oscillatoriales cyanobacterium SpSt-418 TaxID=2282169 RepID=A0A7C3PIZ6_9CYAN